MLCLAKILFEQRSELYCIGDMTNRGLHIFNELDDFELNVKFPLKNYKGFYEEYEDDVGEMQEQSVTVLYKPITLVELQLLFKTNPEMLDYLTELQQEV